MSKTKLKVVISPRPNRNKGDTTRFPQAGHSGYPRASEDAILASWLRTGNTEFLEIPTIDGVIIYKAGFGRTTCWRID